MLKLVSSIVGIKLYKLSSLHLRIQALVKVMDLPLNVKPIGYRWVYKIKHHDEGTIERFKVRLVFKGYNQIEGLDYFKTCSHVAKLTTVRTVVDLASI